GFHNAQPLETILKIFPHLAVIGFMLKHARRLAAFFKFHIFMTFIVLEGAGWKFNFLGASLHGTSLTGQVCPISVVLEDGQAFQQKRQAGHFQAVRKFRASLRQSGRYLSLLWPSGPSIVSPAPHARPALENVLVARSPPAIQVKSRFGGFSERRFSTPCKV